MLQHAGLKVVQLNADGSVHAYICTSVARSGQSVAVVSMLVFLTSISVIF